MYAAWYQRTWGTRSISLNPGPLGTSSDQHDGECRRQSLGGFGVQATELAISEEPNFAFRRQWIYILAVFIPLFWLSSNLSFSQTEEGVSPSDVGPSEVLADSSDSTEAGTPAEVVADLQSDSNIPASSTVTPLPLSNAKPLSETEKSVTGKTTEDKKAIKLEATDSASRNIQFALLRAKNELDPARLPDVVAAKVKLLKALTDLENFVVVGSANGDRWSEFLGLNDLRKEIEKESPSPAVLTDIEMNLRQNYLGLEYPQFVRLRSELKAYTNAVKYGSNTERTVELLQAKIDELINELNEPQKDSGLERMSSIGLVVSYLYESNQATGPLHDIRAQFSVPAVEVYGREGLVNRFVGRCVAEPRPVEECILGTYVRGQAFMSGVLSADVRPMTGGVALALNLSGNITSQNRGTNRGVVVYTSGNSPVNATKMVYATPDGISTSEADVSTYLTTTIHSIEHKRRIVRRIAKKKAAQQKPLADSIARGRLQNRLENQFESQVNEQLATANERLVAAKSSSRPELQRIGIPKPDLAVYSTDSSIHGEVVTAAAYQLSANRSCLIPEPMSADVIVRAHQSSVINALDIVLGGRTIRSRDFDSYAQQIIGFVPEEVKKESEGEEWSITMATFHPVEVEFDQNLITIKLRISQMTRGSQTLADPAIISATYIPEFIDGAFRLQRQGEVSIEFARVSRGVRVVTLRSFLKGKFDKAFKEEIVSKPINLQQRFPRAPNTAIDSLALDDGWVQLGVQMK